MPELIIKLEDMVLQTVRFDGDRLHIGRSRENDIILENLSVSRHHAQLRNHDGRFILADMNSANGILVNGVCVTKTEIAHEDVITIGKHRLIFNNPATMEELTVADVSFHNSGNTPAAARSEAWLEVESGRLKGREFKITRFETSLGKAPSNDIVLTDDWLLGKKQAIILRKGNNAFEIQDLGGLRKIKVNGSAIPERADLKDGSLLEIGGTKLVFHAATPNPPKIRKPLIEQPLQKRTPLNKVREGSSSPPDMVGFAENESLDLEDEPASNRAPSAETPALVSSRNTMKSPVAEEEQPMLSPSVGKPTANIYEGTNDSRRRRPAGPARKTASPTKKSQNTNGSETPVVNEAVENGRDADHEKEIKIWEAALDSPSPAIRRQATRTLKKLTGRDYEA